LYGDALMKKKDESLMVATTNHENLHYRKRLIKQDDCVRNLDLQTSYQHYETQKMSDTEPTQTKLAQTPKPLLHRTERCMPNLDGIRLRD
jgi:hypothetical protein